METVANIQRFSNQPYRAEWLHNNSGMSILSSILEGVDPKTRRGLL